MKVAPRKTTSGYRNGPGCTVCDLEDEKLQRVNAEIWDGSSQRTSGYRARGIRAYYAVSGKTIDAKTITRHAEHTEETWHEVTPQWPAAESEVPVFASDYKSIVDRAANLGAFAISKLEQRVAKGIIEDRELVSLAKMGVTSRAQQEANRVAENRPQTQVALIFGLAGGHLAGALPEHEVIDITPERELLDEVHAERKALAAVAGRGPERADPEGDYDGLF